MPNLLDADGHVLVAVACLSIVVPASPLTTCGHHGSSSVGYADAAGRKRGSGLAGGLLGQVQLQQVVRRGRVCRHRHRTPRHLNVLVIASTQLRGVLAVCADTPKTSARSHVGEQTRTGRVGHVASSSPCHDPLHHPANVLEITTCLSSLPKPMLLVACPAETPGSALQLGGACLRERNCRVDQSVHTWRC